jgi:hypothetical protein
MTMIRQRDVEGVYPWDWKEYDHYMWEGPESKRFLKRKHSKQIRSRGKVNLRQKMGYYNNLEAERQIEHEEDFLLEIELYDDDYEEHWLESA